MLTGVKECTQLCKVMFTGIRECWLVSGRFDWYQGMLTGVRECLLVPGSVYWCQGVGTAITKR